jgi:nucleotide-binding universal stress UspA family protein
MTYRAILVHVPLGNAQGQVELAAHLAKEFEAHLTGVCSLPEVAILRSAQHNPFIRLEANNIDELIKHEYGEAKAAEKKFTAIADKAGVAHDWLTGEGESADIIIHASRLQDLAVVEQGGDPSDLLWGPAVQVALSGHPALIVPRSWRSPEFGRRVLIAWNGSAQASTAVRKALPLLRRAGQVTVLIGTSRGAFPAALRMTALDLPAYLRHQGISAETKDIDEPDMDAGEAILKCAKKIDSDLIVMGAFGRSRFQEWILGGATRHVLERMTVPVFMVHQ